MRERSSPESEDGVDIETAIVVVGLVLAAYLIGSIPMGVIAARFAGGPDPRTIGSGRTGGTNTLRALGRNWALVVVAADLAKGALPVLLARLVTGGSPTLEAVCGFAAILGATRSVFIGLKGGRGVATGVGTMLVIQPLAVLLAAPVFFVTVIVSRYVSLASLVGAAAICPATIIAFSWTEGSVPLVFVAYTVAGAALVWIAHADNIARLLHGEERRFDFRMLGGGKSGAD